MEKNTKYLEIIGFETIKILIEDGIVNLQQGDKCVKVPLHFWDAFSKHANALADSAIEAILEKVDKNL